MWLHSGDKTRVHVRPFIDLSVLVRGVSIMREHGMETIHYPGRAPVFKTQITTPLAV